MSVRGCAGWLLGLVLTLLLAAPARADRIVLKPGHRVDGKTAVEGRILARSAMAIFVKVAGGRTTRIPLEWIDRIQAAPAGASTQPAPTTEAHSAQMAPVPASERAEEISRKRLGEGFLLKRSPHFSVFYRGKTWMLESAVSLLESVYRRYFAYFNAKGSPVRPPNHKLIAIVFDEKQAYVDYGKTLNLDLRITNGFYFAPHNTLCFFVRTGGEAHERVIKHLKRTEKQLDKYRKVLRRMESGETVVLKTADGQRRRLGRRGLRKAIKDSERIVQQTRIKLNASRRAADVSVLTHEATHQLCYNTGMLQRGAETPLWFVEGLAMMFETSRGRRWQGPAATNANRLRDYKKVRDAGVLYLLAKLLVKRDFLSGGAKDARVVYSQSWALVSFLMKTRKAQCVQYLGTLGRYRPGQKVDDARMLGDFRQAFGEDLQGLEAEWKAYMDRL